VFAFYVGILPIVSDGPVLFQKLYVPYLSMYGTVGIFKNI
jgi:hypothetical protein